jgi:fructose-1,6-bisphosphatase
MSGASGIGTDPNSCWRLCWLHGRTTASLGVLQGWTEGLKKYMDSLKTKDNINGKAYSSRYIGSLVR